MSKNTTDIGELIPEENLSFDDFYNDLKAEPNNFSNWFPKVKDCGIPCPDTVIVPVPPEVTRSYFMERPGDGDRIRTFIKDILLPAIPEDFGDRIFIKNGCFSDKFIFKYCSPERTEEALYRSILEINMDSFAFDTGGNTELIVRRLVGVDDPAFPDTIYEGLRLRPEIRMFHDFDSGKTLYGADYWDWDYCHEAICRDEHDKEVYERVYPVIKTFVKEAAPEVMKLVNGKMRGVDLKGIWSVDLMHADGRWYLIDMAEGRRSAYWNPELVKKLLKE